MVESHIRLHMRPNQLAAQHSGEKAALKLLDESVCFEDLLLLAKADRMGQGREDTAKEYLFRMAALYRARTEKEGVTGEDLIRAGFAAGADFKEALAFGRKLTLYGIEKEEALREVCGMLAKNRKKRKA